jgi:hypothetical protein
MDTENSNLLSQNLHTPRWPDLNNISTEEFKNIRILLAKMSKDARKKSALVIYKDTALSPLYSKAIGKPGSEEEKIFRNALPSSPEAFLLDFMANVLSEFDVACREFKK